MPVRDCLRKEGQKNTRGNRGTDHSRNIGPHGMHEGIDTSVGIGRYKYLDNTG